MQAQTPACTMFGVLLVLTHKTCLFENCDDPNNVALSAGHIEETSPVAMRNVTR